MAIEATTAERLSEPARTFVAREHGLLIDGEWRAAADGRTFPTYDPSTGTVAAEVAFAGSDDVDAAVSSARRAFEIGAPWRELSAAERGRRIQALAELVEAHQEELAELESLDNGKPLKFAKRVDVADCIAYLEYYAGWPTKIDGATVPTGDPRIFCYTRREPVGVCAQIVPWNFPLLMAIWKVGPALAAGCTIVLKPAEQTPLTALRLGELALEAGLPPGVLNMLTGDGSSRRGARRPSGRRQGRVHRLERRRARDRRAVRTRPQARDARARREVARTSSSPTPTSMPRSRAPSRPSTTTPARSALPAPVCWCSVSSSTRSCGPRRQGAGNGARPGLDPKTYVGPLVSAEQLERVSGYIETGREEAELLVGGGASGDGGWFVEPTVFATDDDRATIVREEIFGPVLVAQPYDSLEEVAKRANDSEYGLAAGIWTRDISSAHRLAALLEAGSVYVNTWGAGGPGSPFGGRKQSGLGRERGLEGLGAYLETKSVYVAL